MFLISQHRDDPKALKELARSDIGSYLVALEYLPSASRIPAINALSDGIETSVIFSRYSLGDDCNEDKILTIQVGKKKGCRQHD